MAFAAGPPKPTNHSVASRLHYDSMQPCQLSKQLMTPCFGDFFSRFVTTTVVEAPSPFVMHVVCSDGVAMPFAILGDSSSE